MRLGEVWTRVRAEFVGERAAGVLERGQCLGGPASRVQGPHQLGTRPLTQRVLGDSGAQLVEDVGGAAERDLRVDPVGGRLGPQFGQPGGLDLYRRYRRDIGERRSAPQRERLAEQVAGPRRIALGQFATAFTGQPLEPVHVHFVRFDPEAVPRRGEFDRQFQRAAQPRDL